MKDNYISVATSKGDVYYREISFFEYKNLCKMLISNDISDINKAIELLFENCLLKKENLNIVDKFKCLISIRNTIHGKEIAFNSDGKQINFDLSLLLDQEFDETPIVHDILTFDSPLNFHSVNYDEYLSQCLVNVNGKDVTGFSLQEKNELIGATSLSITEIYKKLFDTFKDRNVTLFKDIKINIYSQEYILNFIRNILYEDIFQLLQFEYLCMRNLDFKSEDFKTYTYPEIKIFLNHLNKEREVQKEGMPKPK